MVVLFVPRISPAWVLAALSVRRTGCHRDERVKGRMGGVFEAAVSWMEGKMAGLWEEKEC
jgi:hypothetical protein